MEPTKDEVIQKLKDLYASIPESLQKAIMSSDYQRKLVEIGQKNKLTITQLGDLELATTFVMLGATSPNNYPKELQEKLGIQDQAAVGKIVDEINTEIFAVIREELQEINKLEGDGDEEEVTSQESETLKKSGIEIEQKPTPAPVMPTPAVSGSSSALQARANILDGIEHPKSSAPSFMKDQLSGAFSMPTKETTYKPTPTPSGKGAPIPPPTTPVTPTTNDKPSTDPYREAV